MPFGTRLINFLEVCPDLRCRNCNDVIEIDERGPKPIAIGAIAKTSDGPLAVCRKCYRLKHAPGPKISAARGAPARVQEPQRRRTKPQKASNPSRIKTKRSHSIVLRSILEIIRALQLEADVLEALGAKAPLPMPEEPGLPALPEEESLPEPLEDEIVEPEDDFEAPKAPRFMELVARAKARMQPQEAWSSDPMFGLTLDENGNPKPERHLLAIDDPEYRPLAPAGEGRGISFSDDELDSRF